MKKFPLPGRFVPVSENLPLKHGRYTVLMERGWFRNMYWRGYWVRNLWLRMTRNHVTHWQNEVATFGGSELPISGPKSYGTVEYWKSRISTTRYRNRQLYENMKMP